MKLSILILNFVCLYNLINTAAVPQQLIEDWWKRTAIYDVNVWTFKDDNADGIGDLKGVSSKVNHLADIGVGVIQLSPIFASLDRIGFKSGIENFTKIHPILGTSEDFDTLMRKAEALGIQVILDVPINRCSRNHEWFKKSQQKIEPYTDYFIWKRSNEKNSEEEYDEKTANRWEWDTIRKEYFYRYDDYSPYLNFRSKPLIIEIQAIVEFWLSRGVSGVNLLSVNDYIEDPILNHIQRPFLILFNEVRNLIDVWNRQHNGFEKILTVDKGYDSNLIDLHGGERWPMANIVSNHLFGNFLPLNDISKHKSYKATLFEDLVIYITEEVKKGLTSFVVEDAESSTLYTRLKNRRLYDVFITFLYMCPGLVHIHNGQEIALSDAIPSRSKIDRYSPNHPAMHWDDLLNAGFTSAKTSSIRPNRNYRKVNVESLKKAQLSTYHLVKDLLKLREKISTSDENEVNVYTPSEWVFAFTRLSDQKEYYFTVQNTGDTTYEFYSNELFESLTDKVKVVAATPNSLYQKGNEISTNDPWELSPMSAVVFVVRQDDVKFYD